MSTKGGDLRLLGLIFGDVGVDFSQLSLHGLTILGDDFVGVGEQLQVHLVRHAQCRCGEEEIEKWRVAGLANNKEA